MKYFKKLTASSSWDAPIRLFLADTDVFSSSYSIFFFFRLLQEEEKCVADYLRCQF